MEEEIYKRVIGFPKYLVSSLGNVKSDKTKSNKLSGRVLKPAFAEKGKYKFVTLMEDNGKKRTMRIARLVCEAFHGEKPSARHHVCHNNGDSQDNRAINLRWDTPEGNQADRKSHGTHIEGSKVYGSKLTEKDIPIIRRLIASSVPFGIIANAYQVDTNAIFSIKKGKTWNCVAIEASA